MKSLGVIVATVILAAAIAFYGLCGRYVLIDNVDGTRLWKVDRLTGQVKMISELRVGERVGNFIEVEIEPLTKRERLDGLEE